jgi:hypothetical protein
VTWARRNANLWMCCKNSDYREACKEGRAPFPYGPKGKLVCCQCPTGEVLNNDKNGCVPLLTTAKPTPCPTSQPTPSPSAVPAHTPSGPTPPPSTTAKPTPLLTFQPTPSPTVPVPTPSGPTPAPTDQPTPLPTDESTITPTSAPSKGSCQDLFGEEWRVKDPATLLYSRNPKKYYGKQLFLFCCNEMFYVCEEFHNFWREEKVADTGETKLVEMCCQCKGPMKKWNNPREETPAYCSYS